ncbi:MAG: response regulator, partial [Acidobacteria bacterium]|nr:response regulator [Acidobacteriota bacterium]
MTDRKPRILIAEDFEEVRAPLKLMLKLAGFDALEAEDGQQAIEIVRREKPELVLIDITLPVVDGLQATRQIRSDPQFERLPIIIVSAHDNEDIRQQARAAGG